MSDPVPPPPPRPRRPPRPAGSEGPQAPPERTPEPTVVTVTVHEVGDREVLVRLADGRTGVIERRDVDQAVASPVAGQELRAAVLQRNDSRGRVHMSAAWAAKSDAWRRVAAALEDHTILEGQVTAEIKGGFVVDLGLRAFLPRSLAGELPAGGLVGTTVPVTVSEIDRSRDRLVVSRRDALRRTRRAAEKEQWSALEEGQRLTGSVVELLDYGARVRVGDIAGLVHRSELSWNHFEHPGEVVSVGDEVEVEVIEVSRSRRRLGLSLRATTSNPVDSVQEGSVYDATVVSVVDYGAFVRVAPSGAEGLVHISELSEVPGRRPDQLVVPGEELRVKVLSVDARRNRISFSALQANLIE